MLNKSKTIGNPVLHLSLSFGVLGLCLVVFTPPARAEGSSFADIKRALYESPRSDLPAYPGLVVSDVIKNFFGSEEKPTHGLGVQSRRLMVDESDLRGTREPKWLHPRGACAEAKWLITEKSPATGMFSKTGVAVPAIVRISSGDAVSQYPSDGRILGMAIKIFPTTHLDQAVKTTNIITLDQAGFERSKRKFVFSGEDTGEKIYFTNVAPATSALGKFLSTFFDRFDQPNFARPLYATAAASLGGGVLIDRVTPYEIRFVPDESMKAPAKASADFRLELQENQKRILKIIIESFDGKTKISQKIGSLELGRFVVSDFCDLDLQFHHSPIEDQWSKYKNYDVVKDLAPKD